MIFTLIPAILSLLATTVLAVPNPMPCNGICTNTHDPSIARGPDGTYFRFSTGNKISIHSAPTIYGPWTFQGSALPQCSSIRKTGRCDLWAPQVHQVGDTYYMYYSVSSFGSQDSAIGVATSKTLASGSWTDLGSTGVESRPGDIFNAIDGALVQEGDSFTLAFGSFWGDIFTLPLGNPPTRAVSNNELNVIFDPNPPQAVEGAYIFPYADTHWMFFSAGKCCGLDRDRPAPGDEYSIRVCKSTTGGANGPYVDRNGQSCMQGGGTILLGSHDYVYAPGGQGVMDDPVVGPVVYYHYIDTRIGYQDGQKQLGINSLDFSRGWPRIVKLRP